MSLFNCERSCPCPKPEPSQKLVVLTGGPGAGKTAVLEVLRKTLCESVAVLPEAASILFSGGFWRLDSDEAVQSTQRAIYHVQNELQNIFFKSTQWGLGLCDRGTLDGLAYWPSSQSEFFEQLNTTKARELAKYVAVIHLRVPTLTNGYNHQNPVRIESAQRAMEIDQQIAEVWRSHPQYFEVPSSSDFAEKIRQTSKLVYQILPECCQHHLRGPK